MTAAFTVVTDEFLGIPETGELEWMNAPAPVGTLFQSVSASRKKAFPGSWTDLFYFLKKDSKPFAAKETQPLISLCSYGERRTEKGSYRTADNVVMCYGIEGDYDGEKVSIESARVLLEDAGVRAVLYTSWSSTPGKPRWRVLCPLSKAHSPAERERLVARVNGVLGGILAGESFTLSQSYFYGRHPTNIFTCLATFDDPTDGQCIDLLDELDAMAVGKPGAESKPGKPTEKRPVDDMLGELLRGDDVHGNALRIVARMVAQGVDNQTIKATFRVLAQGVADNRDAGRAAQLVGDELQRMIDGARSKGYTPQIIAELMAEGEEVLTYTRKEIAGMIEATDDYDELTGRIAKLVCACNLKETDRQSLRKFIAKKAGVSVSSLKADAKLYTHVNADKDSDHLKAARETLKAYGTGNLIESTASLWRWRGDGVWREMDDREVKQKIHDVAANDALTSSVVGSVLDLIKTEAHRPGHRFDDANSDINCLNGMLRWAKEGFWEVVPHDREQYRTTQVPIAYDPNATAPRFEQFLKEVFAGTPDSDARISVVCEALGYSLVPSCYLEKFFMLIGRGANGKSVLLSVLSALVGRDQTAAVQPSQFENRFQRAHLQGKLANIITEIAEGAEIADAQLKSLVSGEMTTAEHKMKPPFEFVPFAKHWFGTNHMPHSRDFSDALFRRAVILEFPNKFDGSKRDVHLTSKLNAELPGIFNMALTGLARLIEKRAFTPCASSDDLTRQWRLEADQVAQFVEETCRSVPGESITSGFIYQQYELWADQAGINRTLNRKNFTTRLERLGFLSGKGTGGVRMIYGLKLSSGTD